MATVTFDTLELVDKLNSAGISQEQAEEAVVRVIAKAQDTLAAREYSDFKFEKELSPV